MNITKIYLILKEVYYNLISLFKKNKADLYKKLIELCKLEIKQFRLKSIKEDFIKDNELIIDDFEKKLNEESINILKTRYELIVKKISLVRDEIKEILQKEIKDKLVDAAKDEISKDKEKTEEKIEPINDNEK